MLWEFFCWRWFFGGCQMSPSQCEMCTEWSFSHPLPYLSNLWKGCLLKGGGCPVIMLFKTLRRIVLKRHYLSPGFFSDILCRIGLNLEEPIQMKTSWPSLMYRSYFTLSAYIVSVIPGLLLLYVPLLPSSLIILGRMVAGMFLLLFVHSQINEEFNISLFPFHSQAEL